MIQLNEFCHQYLPKYFEHKYKEGNIKKEFFEYKNQGNVFELTGKIFSLVDQLHIANPQLEPTKLINKYFLFTFADFSSNCKDVREERTEEGAIKAIRKILKKMEDYHRQFFLIFIKLIYLYFDSKQKDDNNDLKKKQNRKQYMDRIPVYYKDLRLQAQLTQTSFIPYFFMDYAITMILNMKPNQKFLKIIEQLLVEFQFPEIVHQKITNHIKQITEKLKLKEIRINAKKTKLSEEQNSQSGKKSFTEIQTKIDSNQGTPIKEKSVEKNQQKTLETSQKKQHMVIKHLKSEQISLQSMRTSLGLQRKPSNTAKQRTLYMRSKYVISKNSLMNNSKMSSTASKLNNLHEMRFSELNRSFSSRCLEINFCDEEDCLAGATPKPKKKVKTQTESEVQKFDQNGNFIHKN